ncbi:MAG: hypothetical protein R6U52_08620, partial [Kosmotogaceae bacterium]
KKIRIPIEAMKWSGITTEKSINVEPHSIVLRKVNSRAVTLKITKEKMKDGREISYYEPKTNLGN